VGFLLAEYSALLIKEKETGSFIFGALLE